MKENINFKTDQLTVVKIWCSVINRVPYYIISKFFEFTGTLVSTSLIETETSFVWNRDNVPTFYLSTEIPDNRDKNICYINTSIEPWKNVTLGNCGLDILGGVNEDGKSNAFLPIIEYMKQVMEEFPEDIYSRLWNVFIESNMAKPLQNLDFFKGLVYAYDSIYANSEQILTGAIKELDSINDNFLKDSFQYQYSKLYLKEKINETCGFRLESLKLWEETTTFRGKFKAFSIFSKDLAYKTSDLRNECIDLRRKYGKKIVLLLLELQVIAYASDEYSISSDLYGRIIKKLETYKNKYECLKTVLSDIYFKNSRYKRRFNLLNEEKILIAKSYICNKDYRNSYWVGVNYEVEREKPGMGLHVLKRAIEYLKECEKLLSVYLEGELNPVEMNYYFRTCTLICKISKELKDYNQSIEFGLKAYHFFENVIKNLGFYVKIYGESESGIYLNACVTRTATMTLYQSLTESYQEIGEMEASNYFRSLY